MIKRILVVFICVAAIVASLVLPASAASLDYNDYITDVQIDGTDDLVTVTLPVDANTHYTYFEKVGSSYQVLGEPVVATGVSKTLEYGKTYVIQFIPLFGDYILLEDIPNGTLASVDIDLTFSSPAMNTPHLENYVRYYNSAGNMVNSAVFEYANEAPSMAFPAQFMINRYEGATEFNCTFTFQDFSLANDSVSPQYVGITVKSYSLIMRISSLLRLQQQSGRTNKILEAVEDKLAEQGKTLEEVLGAQQDTNDKLDDIINDKVDPSLPSGSDVVGDLDDAEGQIRDDAQSGLDQGAQVQQSAIQVMEQYLSAFACVSWIFDRFSTIPFVSGLLALSFSLGITGAILGIGLSIARSYSGSSRSSRSARSKGG